MLANHLIDGIGKHRSLCFNSLNINKVKTHIAVAALCEIDSSLRLKGELARSELLIVHSSAIQFGNGVIACQEIPHAVGVLAGIKDCRSQLVGSCLQFRNCHVTLGSVSRS